MATAQVGTKRHRQSGTRLHLARARRYWEVADILKAAGADDEDIEQTEDPEHLALATATGEDESDE